MEKRSLHKKLDRLESQPLLLVLIVIFTSNPGHLLRLALLQLMVTAMAMTGDQLLHHQVLREFHLLDSKLRMIACLMRTGLDCVWLDVLLLVKIILGA
jgi:hypothetical protein